LRGSEARKLIPGWASKFWGSRLTSLEDLFGVEKPIIGMVHLMPLPGSPAYEGWGMDEIIDNALKDAEALVRGGVDGIIVENMWDLPYFSGASRIPPEEIAAHAVAAAEVIKNVDVPAGITVIHNGGRVALGIAKASGAKFIRVCLYTGAAVWDTGEFDHGNAAELMRVRKLLHAEDIRFFTDIVKKHSVVFPGIDLETHATWSDFYMADALIVTGSMTGVPPNAEDVRRVKKAVPDAPVLIGSGVNLNNVRELFPVADGAIVGTYFKVDGVIQNPVDEGRVSKLMKVVKDLRRSDE
jgi:membrane complex biogenesis BtpA family protein